MILLDGKKLAQKILDGLKQEVAAMKKKPRLAVAVVGENPVVEKFIATKQKAARSVGIDTRIYRFDEHITTNELRKRIAEIVHEKKNSGIIIQLPLPAHINTQYILNSIPQEKDVDVLAAKSIGNVVVGKSIILPPVAGSVKALLDEYSIAYEGKNIVVVGAGSLVGRPVALWLLREHVTFSVIRSSTENPEELLKRADIIISGVGKANFITGAMVKIGVVVIDAGTSESAGKVMGDADFDSVSQKASHITPVPGGVGPLTVAILLKNVVTLAQGK